MSNQKKKPAKDASPDVQTKHGKWTPDVSRKAQDEMEELLTGGNDVGTEATRQPVDKTKLSLPKELDH